MRLEVALVLALPIVVVFCVVLLSGWEPLPPPEEGYEKDQKTEIRIWRLKRILVNLCAAILVAGSAYAFATGITLVILRSIFNGNAYPWLVELVRDLTVMQLHGRVYVAVVALIFAANILYNAVRSWLWNRKYKRLKSSER